jgi:glycosyltransferase involved in cell wall biosynthesis
LRVAIVTDGIWVYGGAERVLEAIFDLYPEADLYALVDFLPEHERAWLKGRPTRTSFLQRLPGARRYFRKLLNLWPVAIEQFDLSGYDLIISSQFAVAHGAVAGPSQAHVAYTHSPMRYAWDLQGQYLREAKLETGPKTLLARSMLHRMRMWDTLAAGRIDAFSANSQFVARRIKKYYRRESRVIHPPVFLDRFTFRENKDDFYLYLGRLVAYKRVDAIVEAFAAMRDRKLIVAGDGPMLKALRAAATPNVQVVGPVDAATANALMGSARAYVYAAVEDFGIAPVEAQAAGTPVIALGKGGLLETVRGITSHRPTGLFFEEQTAEAICRAVETFEGIRSGISPQDCRMNAARFSRATFTDGFADFVQQAMREHGTSYLPLQAAADLPVQAAADLPVQAAAE